MATVFKRKPKKDERKDFVKWTMCWIDKDNKRRTRIGVSDYAESLRIATKLEAEAKGIREGTIDQIEIARRQESTRPLIDHIADYQIDMTAKGDTEKHVKRVGNVLSRILADASITMIKDLSPTRIRLAIGRLTVQTKKTNVDPVEASARTKNFYISTVKTFAKWLQDNDRIVKVPSALEAMTGYKENEDRRLMRRAFTKEEIAMILEAAENGRPVEASRGSRVGKRAGNVRWITGPERAALYRLAMGTGFRANEIRTLTPECFHLDGPEPNITLDPRNEKNRKGTKQLIRQELADKLRPFLVGKEPGKPVLNVPERTAKLLRGDMEAAGIPYIDADGLVGDFHALRGSYITQLVMDGTNIKAVQLLARHSTITLTMDRYTKFSEADLRAALEGKKPEKNDTPGDS